MERKKPGPVNAVHGHEQEWHLLGWMGGSLLSPSTFCPLIHTQEAIVSVPELTRGPGILSAQAFSVLSCFGQLLLQMKKVVQFPHLGKPRNFGSNPTFISRELESSLSVFCIQWCPDIPMFKKERKKRQYVGKGNLMCSPERENLVFIFLLPTILNQW